MVFSHLAQILGPFHSKPRLAQWPNPAPSTRGIFSGLPARTKAPPLLGRTRPKHEQNTTNSQHLHQDKCAYCKGCISMQFETNQPYYVLPSTFEMGSPLLT